MVLGYLQQAEKALKEKALFPYFSELKMHNNYLRDTRIGFYNSVCEMNEEDELPDALSLVYNVIDFSLPKFEELMFDFMSFEENLKSGARIELLGLHPLFKDAGFLLLPTQVGFDAYSYFYVGIVSNESYSHLRFEPITTITEEDTMTARYALYDHLETTGNPAVFVLETNIQAPVTETLLPLGGLMIFEYISSGDKKTTF
jgi:hypothetical protein